MNARRPPRRARRVALALALAACAALPGCVTLPPDAPDRALYLDLRKVVQASEDGGWIVQWVRLQSDAEPALRSVCQVDPRASARLLAWLDRAIEAEGGPAEQTFRRTGGDLSRVQEALSLEHTRALLAFAVERAPADCPFWLSPQRDFAGVQTDARRFVLLAETIGLASYVVNTHVPAIIAGGRLLLGHGLGDQWTLAAGPELAAGGAFIPKSGSGLDATFTIAAPVLLRYSRFSRLADVELAPVARFTGGSAWPPGARIEIGGGYSSLRSGAFMSYYMLYLGYEFHPRHDAAPADHTVQLGTRISVDWAL